MKRQLVLHPFLFGLYPVIALLAFNIAQTRPFAALRSLVVIVVITAVLLLLFKLISQNWHKAGLITSIWVFLFLSYGHITRYAEGVITSISAYDLNRYLTAVLAIILILGTWGIWRVVKRDIAGLTGFLNVVTAVALILPLYTIISHSLQNAGVDTAQANELNNVQTTTDPAQLPDIYYIIMDAYGRADTLATLYNYDNTPFLQALEDRGFTIASNSRSNYSQTSLSLSSSLNMQHITYLTERVGVDLEDRAPVIDLLQDNEVMKVLSARGYATVSIDSGWAGTEFKTADHYLTSNAKIINDFEGMLLGNTAPGTLFRSSLLYEQKRRQVLYVFEALPEAAAIPGPKFVFAHVVSPHPPFVFGPDGERINPTRDYTLHDGVGAGLTRDSYIRNYTDQLIYMNTLLLKTLDEILAEAERPSIIVIQGDHGPGAFVNWNSVEGTCLQEKMTILNAYLLPGNRVELYDTITPINSFRLIFNAYLGADYEQLPDESYFSLWDRPYDFIPVTDQIGQSCSG